VPSFTLKLGGGRAILLPGAGRAWRSCGRSCGRSGRGRRMCAGSWRPRRSRLPSCRCVCVVLHGKVHEKHVSLKCSWRPRRSWPPSCRCVCMVLHGKIHETMVSFTSSWRPRRSRPLSCRCVPAQCCNVKVLQKRVHFEVSWRPSRNRADRQARRMNQCQAAGGLICCDPVHLAATVQAFGANVRLCQALKTSTCLVQSPVPRTASKAFEVAGNDG